MPEGEIVRNNQALSVAAEIEMSLLLTLIGLVAGFVLGQALLMVAFGGGRHVYARAYPRLRVAAGAIAVGVTLAGGVLGYSLA